jgi:hypothetical protein
MEYLKRVLNEEVAYPIAEAELSKPISWEFNLTISSSVFAQMTVDLDGKMSFNKEQTP